MTARQKCKRYKQQVFTLSLRAKFADETSDWLSEELQKAKICLENLRTEQERSDKECSILWRKVEELELANAALTTDADKLRREVDFKTFNILELQHTNVNLRDLIQKERTSKAVIEMELDDLKRGSFFSRLFRKAVN